MKTRRVIIEIKPETIRSVLARHGKTFEWFGRQIGIRRQYVCALLRHDRNPGAKMRAKIQVLMMREFALTWDELFRERK